MGEKNGKKNEDETRKSLLFLSQFLFPPPLDILSIFLPCLLISSPLMGHHFFVRGRMRRYIVEVL